MGSSSLWHALFFIATMLKGFVLASEIFYEVLTTPRYNKIIVQFHCLSLLSLDLAFLNWFVKCMFSL